MTQGYLNTCRSQLSSLGFDKSQWSRVLIQQPYWDTAIMDNKFFDVRTCRRICILKIKSIKFKSINNIEAGVGRGEVKFKVGRWR